MSEQNKDLVRRYYDQVINGRRSGRRRRLLRRRAGRGHGCGRGASSTFQAFPDLHVALDEFVAEAATASFLRSTMTGTHDGEFQRHSRRQDATSPAESAEVFRIADGRFVGYWCMVDVAGLMRQLTEEPVAARA